MSDRINLLQNAENVEISPLFNTYSKVIINIDDDTQVSTGADTGRTLELDNPLFGSEVVATKLLNRLAGFQYQPYSVTRALLDPAAEIGDAVSVNGVYGGIYARNRRFSRLMDADISASHDEEINHEYQFETPTERKLKREMGDVRATFAIQADQIAAKVSQTGGNNSSFGWVLNSTSHTWYSDNKEVMKVDSSGLTVTGKIQATSGYIGNDRNGFTISARAIYNGMTSLADTTHNGVYIGTDGIALGKGKFKVDSSGNLNASNGTFGGNVYAKNIQHGGTAGTFPGSGISPGTLGTGQMDTYSSGGIGAGYTAQGTWNNATNANVGIPYIRASSIYAASYLAATSLAVPWGAFSYGGNSIGGRTIKDGDGNYVAVLTY